MKALIFGVFASQDKKNVGKNTKIVYDSMTSLVVNF